MSNEHVRISDAERNNAMNTLGAHFAAGRLTLPEYEERCDQIFAATTRGELQPLFADLPSADRLPATTRRSYSVAEIDELRRRNAKPKAGILGLTTIAALAGTIAIESALSPLVLLLIPTVFILLYVMKLGPSEWHMPNPRQLERERLRELRTRAKMREIEMKQESRARQHEIANQAMNIAEGFLKKKTS